MRVRIPVQNSTVLQPVSLWGVHEAEAVRPQADGRERRAVTQLQDAGRPEAAQAPAVRLGMSELSAGDRYGNRNRQQTV